MLTAGTHFGNRRGRPCVFSGMPVPACHACSPLPPRMGGSPGTVLVAERHSWGSRVQIKEDELRCNSYVCLISAIIAQNEDGAFKEPLAPAESHPPKCAAGAF